MKLLLNKSKNKIKKKSNIRIFIIWYNETIYVITELA